MANALDECVKSEAVPLDIIMNAIMKNDVPWFFQFKSGIPEPEPNSIILKKRVVSISHLAGNYGFKQLGAACEKYKKDYAVGVTGESTDQRILVVTGWKSRALPAAFRLERIDPRQDVRAFYDLQPYSRERLDKIIEILVIPPHEPEKFERSVALKRSPWFYEDVALFMRQIGKFGIPPYLTTHGWPHVENVLCYIRTLGSLYNLSQKKQYILEWAALLHDIGRGAHMIYKDVNNDMAQDHHEKYSARMIEEWFESGSFAGLLTKEEKDQVVALCISHRRESDLPENEDLRYLSILLRIADAMDVDKRRAQKNDREQTLEEAKKDPAWRSSSLPHWLGHRAIQSLRISADRGEINFELIITNPDNAKSTIKRFREEFSKMPGFSQENIREIMVE